MVVKEGEYVYRPGDMMKSLTARPGKKDLVRYAALPLTSPIHLFAQGKVTFKPADAPAFAEWGIPERIRSYCVYSTAARGTLHGVSIEAPRGTTEGHWTIGVGIGEGRLRVQSCQISAPKESGGSAIIARARVPQAKEPLKLTSAAYTAPSIVGCELTGGLHTVAFGGGAQGLLYGCQISGARDAGLFISLGGPDLSMPSRSTSETPGPGPGPAVSGNCFRDSARGVDIPARVVLGPGNTFVDMRAVPAVL